GDRLGSRRPPGGGSSRPRRHPLRTGRCGRARAGDRADGLRARTTSRGGAARPSELLVPELRRRPAHGTRGTRRVAMVGRNASLALVGDLAAKLGLLAVVVVAARSLSTVEYARLGVALAAAGILATVLDAGVSVLLVRDGARDAARRGELFRAALRGRMPFLALVAAAGIVLGAVTGQLGLVVASLGLAAANAATL